MQPTSYAPTVGSVFGPHVSAPAPQQGAPAPSDPSQFGEYSDWAQKELANGYTPDQLHQHLASNGITDYGSNGSQAHSGNWLTHLLPTIGSIAAPALGALLAPETGGLSLLAAAGLSGLGSAAGKAAENATEGKGVENGLVGAGIEGGIGGLMGGLGGKALESGSAALTARAADVAATQGAEETAGKLATAYADVPKPIQSLYNASDNLKHVANLGYDAANPKNLVDVANHSNDVLNEALNNSLAKSGPVDLSNYNDVVRANLGQADPNGSLLGSLEGKPLSRGGYGAPNSQAAKLVQQLQDMGAGVATKSSDPNELRTLVDNLQSMSQKIAPKIDQATGVLDPAQEAAYNLVNSVKNHVSSTLYDRPEVNAALQGQVGNLTAEDVGGSQALADHLNNVLTTAGNNGDKTAAQDLLAHIEQNNNINALGNEGLKAQQIVSSPSARVRAIAPNGAAPSSNGAATAVDNAGNLMSLVNPHAGIVAGALNFAKHAANNPGILDTLSRVSHVAAMGAPTAAKIITTAPNMAADPATQPGAGGIMNNGQPMQTNNSYGSGGNDFQTLINAMEAQSILAPNLAGQSGATSFLGQVAPLLQRNRLIQGELNAMPASYANAGGAQGLGGILSQISGLIPGTAAHTYQQQKGAAAQALGAQLGISPQAAAGLLPGLMQNSQTAGMNQNILGNLSGQLAY